MRTSARPGPGPITTAPALPGAGSAAGSAAAAATRPGRELEFYNLHTGEALRAV